LPAELSQRIQGTFSPVQLHYHYTINRRNIKLMHLVYICTESVCMKKFIIINGPNLNLTGIREPGVYGDTSFDDYLPLLRKEFPELLIEYYQTNIEGEIINKIHETGFSYDGIVLNAGGYTHTSVAIGDAIKSVSTPVVEVHMSNILGREDFRSQTKISAGVKGVIAGFGMNSYRLAIISLLSV